MEKEDSTAAGRGPVGPPLPRGRHGLGPEEVAENQRQRLIAAMAHSVAVRGYAATSVDRVLKGSGVSRGSFYELFGNRQDCLLAAYEASFAQLMERVLAACAEERKWTGQVRASIRAAVEFAVEDPHRARLVALDGFVADAGASRQALAAVDRLARMLRSGREHHPKAAGLPEAMEWTLVSAASTTIGWCLLSGESPAGREQQLAYFVLLPYVGAAAARRLTAQS